MKQPPPPYTPYDPLASRNIGRHLAYELLRQPLHPLPLADRFLGCGVYAIYYCGKFLPYKPITKKKGLDSEDAKPIYIGRTLGSSRKGRSEGDTPSYRMYERLALHCKSICEVPNLKICDFECRFLVLEPAWVLFAEQLLISRYQPLWNTVLDGFGNKALGGGREGESKTSAWDLAHPGRKGTGRIQASKRNANLWKEVEKTLAVPSST